MSFLYFDARGVPVATANKTTRVRPNSKEIEDMDLNELKAAVKEAAEETVGARLDEHEARLADLEAARDDKTIEAQVENVLGKALKTAGITVGASQQVDVDEDDHDLRHAGKAKVSSSARRDAFGRRTHVSA